MRGIERFDRRDAAFAALCVLCLVLVLPAQFVSLVVFDSTGLPGSGTVIYVVVPVLLVGAVPTVVAARLYGWRRAGVFALTMCTAAVAVAILTVGFFVLG